MASDRRITAEVYLEGQRVPFERVTVSVVPNRPAQAQITLPPIDMPQGSGLTRIPPRTLVHVFYEDQLLTETFDDQKMRLLFEGEVTGYGFHKTPSGRGYTLICEDLTNYFSYIYLYLFTDLQNFAHNSQLRGFELLNFAGTTPVQKQFNITAQNTQLAQLLLNPKVPNVFVELIRTAVEQNVVYSEFDEQRKFTRKIAALEDDNIPDMFKSQVLAQILRGEISSSLPAHAKLNQILDHVMAVYFYSSVSNPAASIGYTRTVGMDTRASTTTTKPQLNSLIFKPLTYFSSPPMCNVVFPNQYSSFQFGRNYLQEPTRLHMQTFQIAGLSGKVYVAPNPLVSLLSLDSEADGVESLKNTILDESVILNNFDPSREDIKGIIPDFYQFNNAAFLRGFLVAKGSDDPIDRTGTEGEVPKDQFETELSRYFSEIAEYELLKSQHAPRTADVVGHFNPQWVCGFPMAVLDAEALTFGEVISLSHTIDANGKANSAVRLGYCRNEDILNRETTVAEQNLAERILQSLNAQLSQVSADLVSLYADLDGLALAQQEAETAGDSVEAARLSSLQEEITKQRLNPLLAQQAALQAQVQAQQAEVEAGDAKFTELPPWVNEKFTEENIGEEAYPLLLGSQMKSILKEQPDAGNPNAVFTPTSQDEAARNLLSLYGRTTVKDSFTTRQTKREIATKKEVFDILEATRKNKNEYESSGETGPFRDSILEIVRPIAVRMRNKREYFIN